MKAAQIQEYGSAEVVQVVAIDRPVAGEGQVLVRVEAASLNPFDTAVRQGYMKEFIPLTLPVTLGGDIAGVVEEIGPATLTSLQVGDQVYGQANVAAGNSGAFAEFAATKDSQLAIMPDKITFDEAASLPLVGASALQALYEHIDLQPGQKILIQGGSGGIGSIAVQLAKHLGAYVAATVPADAVERAHELGVDEVINYQAQDFTQLITGYDAVFDTVGGEVFGQSFGVLRPGGIAVTMIAEVDEALAKKHEIQAMRQSTHVTTEVLDRLRVLVEEGVVTTRIAQTFPLEHIQDAFRLRESGVYGKVVITMN